MNSADYITLSIIEKYLDFKTLEVWQEIKKELEIEKVEPVSSDIDCMDEIIFILQNKALTTTIMQKALIESNFEQAILDEKDFYSKIKETYRQKEKSFEDFIGYIDRTSDYKILRDAKEEQLKAIDSSRLHLKKNIQSEKVLIHKTMERKLQTTTFCGRHVLVESTKFNSNHSDDIRKPYVLSDLLVK